MNKNPPHAVFRERILALYDTNPSEVMSHYRNCYPPSDEPETEREYVARVAEQDFEDHDLDACCFPDIAAAVYRECEDTMPTDTQTVLLQYSVLTRKEFTEALVVPADMSKDEITAFAHKRYEDLDGSEFETDPEYWRFSGIQVDLKHDAQSGLGTTGAIRRTDTGLVYIKQ